jgi:hypothetical protein
LKPWDELFDTEYFVRNRADKQERYRKLPRYWLPAGKRQAWDALLCATEIYVSRGRRHTLRDLGGQI